MQLWAFYQCHFPVEYDIKIFPDSRFSARICFTFQLSLQLGKVRVQTTSGRIAV